MGSNVLAAPVLVHASDGLVTASAHRLTVTSLQSGYVVITGNGNAVTTSAVTASQLGFLDGLVDNIQSQLNNAKLQNLGPNRVLTTDPAGNAVTSNVTTTELGHLAGVTSSVQTQLNARANITYVDSQLAGKANTITGSASSITTTNLTENRTLVTGADQKVTTSNVTAAQLACLEGITSSVQDQLNSKQANITGSASSIVTTNLTPNRAVITGADQKVTVSSVTAAELAHLAGVTNPIQTQLNGKQATITGSASSIVTTNLTQHRVLVTGADQKVTTSNVTVSQLECLLGITSSVQDQLNGKQANITGSASSIVTTNLTQHRVLVTGADQKVTTSSVTVSQLDCLLGITSSVQDQLNDKQARIDALDTTSGFTVTTATTVRIGGINRFVADSTGASVTGNFAISGTTYAGALLYLMDEVFIQNVTTLKQFRIGTNEVGGEIRFYVEGDWRAASNVNIWTFRQPVRMIPLVANRALFLDGDREIATGSVTTTELGYLLGVTNPIQTQLNGKQATITGSASSIVSTNLTQHRVLVTGADQKVTTSSVNASQLDCLLGITSSVQDQLNGKQATITGGASSIVSTNLTASRALVSDASGKVAVSAVTATELSMLDGVSTASTIQAQLNGKQATIGLSTALQVASVTFAEAGSYINKTGSNLNMNYVNNQGTGNHTFWVGPTARMNINASNVGVTTVAGMHITPTASQGNAANVLFINANVGIDGRYIACNWGLANFFRVEGDGAVYSYTNTFYGADYAEYFEWADGNPKGEDRCGMCVVLDDAGTVSLATTRQDVGPDDIIGVVSALPSVVGDAAWSQWKHKYLTDEVGRKITEPKEMWEIGAQLYEPNSVPPEVDASAKKVVTVQVPVLNPSFDPAVKYVPRCERPEWAPIGLLGKLRVRVGQPVGARWKLLRHVSPTVDEYLVM